jgi:hypothetical protein
MTFLFAFDNCGEIFSIAEKRVLPYEYPAFQTLENTRFHLHGKHNIDIVAHAFDL